MRTTFVHLIFLIAALQNTAQAGKQEIANLIRSLNLEGKKVALVLVNMRHPASSSEIELSPAGRQERRDLVNDIGSLMKTFQNDENVYFVDLDVMYENTPLKNSRWWYRLQTFVTAKKESYYRRLQFETMDLEGERLEEFEERYYDGWVNVKDYEEWMGHNLKQFLTKEDITSIIIAGNNVDHTVENLAYYNLQTSHRQVIVDADLTGAYEEPDFQEGVWTFLPYRQRRANIKRQWAKMKSQYKDQVIDTTNDAPGKGCTP